MRRRLFPSLCLWAVLGAAGVLACLLPGAAPPEPETPAQQQVRELVEQLGDDSYERREAAGKALEELGDQALPALRQASDSSDPEVGLRARQLVRTINLQLRTSKSTGLVMIAVEAGQFWMGSKAEEAGRQGDEPLHKVRINRPFLLGVGEVTQGQYEQVMKSNPSHFQPLAGGAARVAERDTSNYPVESVSWFEAIEFCNRLSALDGFAPYYELAAVEREEGMIRAAKVSILGGKGYRLPTEAEWEYACRAGTATPFWFGVENTGREANVKPVMVPGGYGEGPKWGAPGRPMPRGSYPANAWGLHDMHGNVGEWCWDWYEADSYKTSPDADPAGADRGTQRVVRGGSWLVLEGSCRSGSRFWQVPAERKNYVGFRVARDP